MNQSVAKGQWQELKGKIKQKWGKLTEDDVTKFEGNWDQLKGKLIQTYGYTKDAVVKEIDEFKAGMSARADDQVDSVHDGAESLKQKAKDLSR